MTLCFVDQPRRYITVRMKGVVDITDATTAAMAEVEALSVDEVTLLSESAVVIDEQKAFGSEGLSSTLR